MTDTTSVSADQLRSIVERIEYIDAEINGLNDGKKDIYAEAKSNGFDLAILKKLVSERRKPAAERLEQEAILELYREAMNAPRAGARARAA